jgi:formylglycine-generating enzyme required for sulfatase activity
MVTMVIGVRFGATELPRDRARLYEACVRAILQAQYIPSDAAREELINWGGPWETQWEWLSDLALAMHVGGRSNAAVREEQVRAALQDKLAADALEAFLRAVRRRGGLFEERGEFFQFSHLTFQEFLAARVLAKQREAARPLLAQHVGDSWWREVFLLVYGCLRMDYKPPAEAYLDWLAHLAGDGDTRLAGAELAGAAVLEIERPDPGARRKQADRLVELLQDETLSVSGALRGAAGRTLARLGDPRAGVGLTPNSLPDIAWCTVPAGEFIMGEGADQHRESISAPYRISKYLITSAQFDAFVQDGGYTDKWRPCWTAAGWQWKGGRTEPDKRGGTFDLPNHPVVMVRWYEAVAFCNWLGEKLGCRVTLPTEAQWEKAASWEEVGKETSPPRPSRSGRGRQGDGGRKRRYPWGEEITPDHANYDATGIGATSAVGIFPKGRSSCGALDMAGNVWEWCLTKWRANYKTAPDDDLEGDAVRVLRGGSCWNDRNVVRCAYRYWHYPGSWFDYPGFRVARSSP